MFFRQQRVFQSYSPFRLAFGRVFVDVTVRKSTLGSNQRILEKKLMSLCSRPSFLPLFHPPTSIIFRGGGGANDSAFPSKADYAIALDNFCQKSNIYPTSFAFKLCLRSEGALAGVLEVSNLATSAKYGIKMVV